KKLGGPGSKYGLPVTAESCSGNSCAQSFERGSIYWTATTGIQPVFTNGDSATVGGTWVALGGVNSKYKFPVSAETCYANHCEQLFQQGRIIWSAAGGVQPVFTASDESTIGGTWVKAGAGTSRYGFPVDAESCSSAS
ncbi:LGFP repeat-containing protein, partial [Escherichia coli]|uniref:LGFP repeat-containing protein n=1 Tax=Escherichia coli TaxID=562 RepID=UPI0032E820D0